MTPSSAVASASLLLLGTESPPRELTAEGLKQAFEELARHVRHTEAAALFRGGGRTPRGAQPAQARPAARSRHPRQGSGTERSRGAKSWYWKGRIPHRPLRLGEFLFYSGVIPCDVLIKAIVDQKGTRPNLGQLACRLGLLSRDELACALDKRVRGERLGDTLVRLEILSRVTVEQLLAEQRRLQRPLGWHLVHMGCLPVADIPSCLSRLWRHNVASRSRT